MSIVKQKIENKRNLFFKKQLFSAVGSSYYRHALVSKNDDFVLY